MRVSGTPLFKYGKPNTGIKDPKVIQKENEGDAWYIIVYICLLCIRLLELYIRI